MLPLWKIGGSKTIKALHIGGSQNVRVNRYLLSATNRGAESILFNPDNKIRVDRPTQKLWIPESSSFSVVHYRDRDRSLEYMFPSNTDGIGLKQTFKEYDCDVVHAHDLQTAYYSINNDLPTVFDDWEFWLKYGFYLFALELRRGEVWNELFRGQRNPLGFLLHFAAWINCYPVAKRVLSKAPVIVTNRFVAEAYENMGVKTFFVPNVPLKYEVDYVESKHIEKDSEIITGYIGGFGNDNGFHPLRNASAVVSMWRKRGIGRLHFFDGSNYCDHLAMLCKLKSFSFNLLFWEPRRIHRYYNQNKAFVASVLGIPTIITASLVDTVNMLGEHALPVTSAEDIPAIMKFYLDNPRDLKLNPAHLWEYYDHNIETAYKEAMK